MENHIKPPGKRKGQKRTEPAAAAEKVDVKREQPAAAERTDGRATPEPIVAEGTPSGEEVVSKLTQPVTNQDEQDKITNADGDDIPRAAQ